MKNFSFLPPPSPQFSLRVIRGSETRQRNGQTIAALSRQTQNTFVIGFPSDNAICIPGDSAFKHSREANNTPFDSRSKASLRNPREEERREAARNRC